MLFPGWAAEQKMDIKYKLGKYKIWAQGYNT